MIFIIQYYPLGWFYCEFIEEEKCLNKYFNSPLGYNKPLGYDAFQEYMQCIHHPHLQYLTDDGIVIRFWNNKAWIVLEAFDSLEAVEKALDILQNYRRNIRIESI